MKKHILFLATIAAAYVFAACSSSDKKEDKTTIEKDSYDLALADKLGMFSALPSQAESAENPITDEKVALGHKLYFDKNLSKDGNISCNSCHNLNTFGVDNLPTSPGDAGKNGGRNSPTVLNAALHATQFWDGRAKDVEEQAGMPILNPIEMAIPKEDFLIDRLSKIEGYSKLFEQAFPGEGNAISYKNLRLAIGAFERKLLTPSAFDNYLNGDLTALNKQEKSGLLTFINVGCASCHNGAALGGNSFQKFGVHKNYWELTGSKNIDKGRAEVTKNEADNYVFKVPSLRNIDKTAPYFHDGSVAKLDKTVEIMAISQLNYNLTTEEKENILAFLKSLTGKVDEKFKKAPVN